jgi:serine/threonine protein kinase
MSSEVAAKMKCPRCQFENPSDTNYCAKCGTPLFHKGEAAYGPTLTMETPLYILERGTTFAGRYEIIEEVGWGGMGRVYKVYDKKIKETIALKLLKPEITSDHRTIERFSNELKFARKISHPNVCRMYDLGEEGEAHFITMEFVPGEDLKSFIRRAGHLSEAKAIFIARQISEGLAEAHRLGVLHRDLKPQNVMIDRDGNAKVMDFGIARSLHAAGVTRTGVMIGTPEYMSPEQADAVELDQRSDIYSLGVILYEMVTGRVPFAGETPLSVALKHKVERPKDPRELNSLISGGLSRLIMKCLEKDREKRYQGAEELRTDLERLEKGLPTAERVLPQKKSAATERKFGWSKFGKVAAATVVLVAVGIIAWTVGQRIFRKEKKVVGGHVTVFERPTIPSPPSEKQIPQVTDRRPDRMTQEKSSRSTDASRFVTPLLKEAMKYMTPEDIGQIEKKLEEIQGMLPADSRYMKFWNEARAKFEESRRHKEAGQIQQSEKSYEEGQSQMRNLLGVVEAKEKADAAKAEMESAKKRAAEALPVNREYLLFRVAAAKESDAADAYAKEDFAGARTLYVVLKRVYELSPLAAKEEGAVSLLRSYLNAIKTEAMTISAPKYAAWYFEEAQKEEAAAEKLNIKKEYAAAAENYIRAAFLYEKAKEKAAEATPAKE